MGTLQQHLVRAIPNTVTDLETALFRLPEDKRNWSPMGDARTALDMIAECAMLADCTEIVTTRSFPGDFDFAAYQQAKAELINGDWEVLHALLHENTQKTVATIAAVPDADLGIEIQFPWGPMTIAQTITYPYWNNCYHEGQINYIASMLGCLD